MAKERHKETIYLLMADPHIPADAKPKNSRFAKAAGKALFKMTDRGNSRAESILGHFRKKA